MGSIVKHGFKFQFHYEGTEGKKGQRKGSVAIPWEAEWLWEGASGSPVGIWRLG